MIGIHETAYPRLKQNFSEQELKEIYTPTDSERLFVTSQYRQATHRFTGPLLAKGIQVSMEGRTRVLNNGEYSIQTNNDVEWLPVSF